jgi:hypothetical protein
MQKLSGGEETGIRTSRSDPDMYFPQTTGTMPFVGGGGPVAVNPLIGVTTLKHHADKPPVPSPSGTDFGLGYRIFRSRPFHPIPPDFHNIIRFIRHGMLLRPIFQNVTKSIINENRPVPTFSLKIRDFSIFPGINKREIST